MAAAALVVWSCAPQPLPDEPGAGSAGGSGGTAGSSSNGPSAGRAGFAGRGGTGGRGGISGSGGSGAGGRGGNGAAGTGAGGASGRAGAAGAGGKHTACQNACGVQVLVGSEARPHGIAVGGGSIYWSNAPVGAGDNLRRSTLMGTAVETLASLSAAEEAGQIAFDDGVLYWAQLLGSRIYRSPTASITASPIVSGRSNTLGIAVGGNLVFWTERSKIFGTLKGGGEAVVWHTDGSSTELLGLAVDASSLYVAAGDIAKVRRISLDGGAVLDLATGVRPFGLAVAGADLYWTDESAGTVNRVPIAGGSSVVVANGQLRPNGIATDGTWVYWVTSGTGGNGTVVRLPLCCSAGAASGA